MTAQPGTTVVIQQQQKMEREWNSGLFACFEDMGSCLMGLCCPCIQICSISSRMGEGFLYGCCCANLARFTLRAKLRAEQQIQGSLCNDAILGLFCTNCILCQMDRELKSMGKWLWNSKRAKLFSCFGLHMLVYSLLKKKVYSLIVVFKKHSLQLFVFLYFALKSCKCD